MANIMYPQTLALATVSSQGLQAPTTTSGRKGPKKVCRLTKWLTSAQAKLRTTISRPVTTTTEKKSCYPMSSKSTQQRRIHNEVFGWTSDAFDEMSMNSSSSSTTSLTSPSPSSSSTDTRSREQLLREADDAMISRLENAFVHGTNHHFRGCRTYLRIEGY